MKNEELKMLRQFVETVFDLTHSLDNDNSPKAKENLLRTIGSLVYSVQEISEMYQREEANHD